MTEIAAFTNRPECPKCGGDRFSWLYTKESHGKDRVLTGQHLLLACERCKFMFAMRTKDGEG